MPIHPLAHPVCNPEAYIHCARRGASQVKTLKPLSTIKLQQLCALMEEETFVNEQYIATEGETGEKFFIAVTGMVRPKYLYYNLSGQATIPN